MRFQPLTVAEVRKTTRDAVVVTFDPAPGFEFRAGQYLTFRRLFEGVEVRRSYSICAAPGEALQVGIKRVDGGAFSTWANEALAPGDRIDAMLPMGRFTPEIEPNTGKHTLLIAVGSGITPVLSIAQALLQAGGRVTLLYGNRAVNTIMFQTELDDLKSRFLTRLAVVHVLKQDAQDIPLFTGRLDGAKLDALFAAWVQIDTVDEAFLCGPESMMDVAVERLVAHGLPPERIQTERFVGTQTGRLPQITRATVAAKPTEVTLRLDGAAHVVTMERDQSLLEAALENAIDAPYACKAGVCSTCMCRVVEGEVEMVQNHALEDDEVAHGYVLSCQAYPLSDRVVVDYDVGH
ncbi:phenylacetic acid degradation protein [Jannaschia pagri]|uniref:Phenylacetic acid degradation protein n=1 Tax=Jannaschia pagri TaxID=2829797 RepID=A0ABQ4NMB7_9RHOB|nr:MULTISPECIES: 2Fe-2S iron-sulfur cluster-binding protein [unclassified Jannaschia]GIT91535.1 phenylacetic acid degradation protein [Jannaschia sp. AI_61]GIT95369.1 phenylacetic acid degradation protein [Jannaschia sp. AI_62]